jgi:hypothetical protein
MEKVASSAISPYDVKDLEVEPVKPASVKVMDVASVRSYVS